MLVYMQVGKCSADYAMWPETMYSQFGNKWANLYNGPMWSVAMVEQGAATQPGGRSWDTVDVSHLVPSSMVN